jgi:peptidoglycan/xylan/chitin deacetylase (PgdA/CDA1 family)
MGIRMAPPSRPPIGFGRLMSLLLLASLAVVAWRGGLLEQVRGARRISSVLSLGKEGSAGGGSAAQDGSAALVARPQDPRGDLRAVQRFIQLGYPLYCGGGNGKFVALTFDDGPGPYTLKTLRILSLAKVRATFFMVGRNIGWYPRVSDRVLPANAVGDHTWTHAYLTRLSVPNQTREIQSTQAALAKASAGKALMFRPPGGFHTPAIDEMINSLGMLEVMWTVDSMDSAGAATNEVLANAIAGLRPGAIILMHENRGTTLAMLPRLLREIRRQGYQAVTVPELLRLDPPTVEQLQGTLHGCAA